jgi:uncharacterized membrane protein
MAMQYQGHWLRTRRQALWQDVALFVVLLPLALWRATTQPIGAGIGLVVLTLAPFAIAYQTWRFLEQQERVHEEPTAEMQFVFRFLVNTPLTFGALLLVVLAGLR